MLELREKTKAPIEAMQYLYPTQVKEFARVVDGMVDVVTREVYVSTPVGVRKVGINDWVIRRGDEWFVIGDTEIHEQYEPLDTAAAARATGGRSWE